MIRLFYSFLILFFLTAVVTAANWIYLPATTAAFDTTDIASLIHYRADNLSLTGTTIDGFTDLSGNGNDAGYLAGTKWTVTASNASINNKPSAVGNASGRYDPGDGTNFLGADTSKVLLFIVLKGASIGAGVFQGIFTIGWGVNELALLHANDASWGPFYFGKTGAPMIRETSISSATLTSWHYIIAYYNGGGSPSTTTNWNLIFNGVAQSPDAAPAGGSGGTADAVLGSWRTGGLTFGGELAELLIAKDVTLDSSLEANLISYAASQYGL